MNTTIKTIFVATCLLTTKITTHAQFKTTKTQRNAALSANQPVNSSIVDRVKSIPIQKVNLGQVKGTFKIPAPGAWSSKIGNLFTDYVWRLNNIGTSSSNTPDRRNQENEECYKAGGYTKVTFFDGEIRFDSTDKQNIKFVIYNVPYASSYNTMEHSRTYGKNYILELVPKNGINPILASGNYLLLQNCFAQNMPNCMSNNPLNNYQGAIITCEAENRISTLNISLSEIFSPQ
jgi:hypothetical protein